MNGYYYDVDRSTGVVYLVNPFAVQPCNLRSTIYDMLNFAGCGLRNRYYPFIINGDPVYVMINSSGYLHYLYKNKTYTWGEDGGYRVSGVFSAMELQRVYIGIVQDNPFKGMLGR